MDGWNPNDFPAVILTRKQHQMNSAKPRNEFYAQRKKYKGHFRRDYVNELRAMDERIYAGLPDGSTASSSSWSSTRP